MLNILVPTTDLLIPVLLLWQLLSTGVSEHGLGNVTGFDICITSGSCQSTNTKNQGFTPSLRATVCGILSETHGECRRASGLLCIWDDFSAKLRINAPLSELMWSMREGKSAAFLSGKNRYDFRGMHHALLWICEHPDTAEVKAPSAVSSATPQKWFLSFLCSPHWLTSFFHCICSPLLSTFHLF